MFDRIPVSEQDDLTIEPLDVTQPVTRDAQDIKGLFAWQRELNPGQSIRLKSGFELRVPEDAELPVEFR